jgi:hypothetical protein
MRTGCPLRIGGDAGGFGGAVEFAAGADVVLGVEVDVVLLVADMLRSSVGDAQVAATSPRAASRNPPRRRTPPAKHARAWPVVIYIGCT